MAGRSSPAAPVALTLHLADAYNRDGGRCTAQSVVSNWAGAMRLTPSINVSQEKLADLCRRHRIRRLALFGSVLRDDFGPNSDIDVLVEFEPGCTPGWEIVDIEEELSGVFGGRRIDMVNPRYLNHRLKDRVLASAVVQYEAPDAA